jgi:hypothetical protein
MIWYTSVVICVFRCTKWRVFGVCARGDRNLRRAGEVSIKEVRYHVRVFQRVLLL